MVGVPLGLSFGGAHDGSLPPLAFPPRAWAVSAVDDDKYFRCIVLLLRVKEATQQEMRLIQSGKFKDIQRNDIKMAVSMMVTNYDLKGTTEILSTRASDKAKFDNLARDTQEYLTTILTYFSSASTKDLEVKALSPEKQKFVLDGLRESGKRIDDMRSLLPSALVSKAEALIAEENRLNDEEYRQADQGAMINPNPNKS